MSWSDEYSCERNAGTGGGVGGLGGGDGVLNDHIELDKESYSYVQFAREGMLTRFPLWNDKPDLNQVLTAADVVSDFNETSNLNW